MTRARHCAWSPAWSDIGLGFIFLVGFAALVLLVSACGGPTVPLPAFDHHHLDPDVSIVEQRATVKRAVDGDTLIVLLEPNGAEVRTRLLGLDTPERGECGYREATDYVLSLAPPGTQVTLHVDATQDDVDRFGRLLRYVYVGDRDLSLAVIQAGWGRHFDDYPVAVSPQLEAAETDAHTHTRGVWSLCP